jgi:hypothetical protein
MNGSNKLCYILLGLPGKNTQAYGIHLLVTKKIPYFIEYSVHFFTLKMMLKYSLHTIHERLLRKDLRWLV